MVKLTAEERARHTRKTLIDIAKRRQRPGSGSARDQYKGAPFVQWPDLTKILTGIPWAIVGGVATSRYMPERFTHDLDIAIERRDAGEVRARFDGGGFVFKALLSIGGSSWETPDGTPVDVIEGDEDWWPDALAEAARLSIEVGGPPVLPLAYLTMMKTRSGRPQDGADVSRMLARASDAELDRVRAVIAERDPELAEDVESLIVVGKLEMQER